jgi:hypothetical protein
MKDTEQRGREEKEEEEEERAASTQAYGWAMRRVRFSLLLSLLALRYPSVFSFFFCSTAFEFSVWGLGLSFRV